VNHRLRLIRRIMIKASPFSTASLAGSTWPKGSALDRLRAAGASNFVAGAKPDAYRLKASKTRDQFAHAIPLRNADI
jgi:hypothetical protein